MTTVSLGWSHTGLADRRRLLLTKTYVANHFPDDALWYHVGGIDWRVASSAVACLKKVRHRYPYVSGSV